MSSVAGTGKNLRTDVNVVKEGNVYKLAGFFRKTWEMRWFRLRGRQLLYYKSELDAASQAPRQTLNLRGARAFRAAEGKISARTEFCVEIQLVEPSTKSYYFCTETEEYLNEWIEAINSAAEYSMKEICKLKGHEEPITCFSFSENAKKMVTGTESGCVKIWDLRLHKLILSLDAHRDGVTSCGFFNQGRRLFTTSMDKTLKVWDGESFQLLTTIQGLDDGVTCCLVITESNQIVLGSATGEIKMWNSNSLQVIGSLSGHKSGITSMTCSTDGKRMLTTSEDGTVICWSMPRATLITVIRHPYSPVHGSIANTGEKFVLWDRENSVSVYFWGEKVEMKFEMNRHSDKVTNCFFTPNAVKVVTASRDRSILIWDAGISGQLLTDLSGQKDSVRCCMVSKNQQLMLSVTGTEVAVWDFHSMELLKTLEHPKQVMRASFIPDFSGIISMQEDGNIQVWSL